MTLWSLLKLTQAWALFEPSICAEIQGRVVIKVVGIILMNWSLRLYIGRIELIAVEFIRISVRVNRGSLHDILVLVIYL